jgi:SAM-dependent methyltransferase
MPLQVTFVDLGKSPLCETYLAPDQLNQMEPFFPLHVYLCEGCLLVQLSEYVSVDSIFSHYPYFSSYSQTWLDHSRRYADAMVDRLGLDSSSLVVELGSNDGYLLQYVGARGVPVLGIEPAANVAEVAIAKGIPTRVLFFGEEPALALKGEGILADLVIGNNVLAQVPDLNSFVAGIKIILKPEGTATLEFPHLMQLVAQNQFDTIYHEHFSYFSLLAARRIFDAHGLAIFDVEELSAHGGSLRIYVRHHENGAIPVTDRVEELIAREDAAGMRSVDFYRGFGQQVEETKRKLLRFLIQAKSDGKVIAGYGAPGKGNTLLNYCGIRTDFIEYTVDRNPYKQGRFLPGTHIPIFHPDKLSETRPDYVLILVWNLKDEVMEQMAHVREWGGSFVVPIPEPKVYPGCDEDGG